MIPSAVVVLVTITLISSTYSASVIHNPRRGTCEHLNDKETPMVSCYSYNEIPTDIAFPGLVTFLEMSKGNNIDILRNGSLIRSYLNSLIVLDLDNCRIRVIEPGAFAGINTLVEIYLSNNLITVLNPDVFAGVVGLTDLHISNNPINIIEEGKSFPHLTELESLDLSNCKLDNISANLFENLASLKKLNLTGNQLKRLDWRVFQSTNKLMSLNLEGNPWHCDCHVNFLMETLKDMGLAKIFKGIACASTEKYSFSWRRHLWNEIRDENMICSSQIDKFVYSTCSNTSEHGEKLNTNGSVQLGHDVFFECEYRGFPRPEVQWYKDGQQIEKNNKNYAYPSAIMASIHHNIEFLADLSWDQGGRNFNYIFREILVVRRVQMEDKGRYKCRLSDSYSYEVVTISEIILPGKVEGETPFMMWMAVFLGFLLGILTAGVTVIVWIKRSKRDERGIIQESGIDLEEFGIKPIISNLSLKSEGIDTSQI